MHGVFGPIIVDRDVGFVSGRKWNLPVFVYCGLRKLVAYDLLTKIVDFLFLA